MLPMLSTYMGHKSVSATSRYLRLTAEVYPELLSTIEEKCAFVIPEVQNEEMLNISGFCSPTFHNYLLCITNAAFLVGDGDDLCVHDFTSFLIVAVVSGNRKSRHFKINSEVTALSIAGIRVPEMKKAPSIYTVCYIKFIFNYSN